MYSTPRLFTSITFLVILFSSLNSSAQTDPPGGAQLSMSMLDDSLTTSSDKTTDGFYYKGIPLTYAAGSRLYIYYSSYGPNYKELSLVFLDDAGKMVRYHSEELLGTKMGTIELDTTFTADGKTNLLFTTEKEGQTLGYTATAAYASPEALAFKSDADFCWKVAYVLKHSDIGYKFITSGQKKGFGTSYSTTAPLRSDAPTASSVYEGVSSIVYKSTIGRGTKDQAETFFSQMEQSLKQCMGTEFEYSSTTDTDGMKKLTCTASASTDGVSVRNLEYMGKDKGGIKPKYIVTVSMVRRTVEGNEVCDIEMEIRNAFYQF